MQPFSMLYSSEMPDDQMDRQIEDLKIDLFNTVILPAINLPYFGNIPYHSAPNFFLKLNHASLATSS